MTRAATSAQSAFTPAAMPDVTPAITSTAPSAITLIRGVAILLWATCPDDPARCATPFMHAAAAALDLAVEVHFSAQSVLLLKLGVADALCADRDRLVTIAAHMQEVHAHGAKFFACAAALANEGMKGCAQRT